MTRSVTALLAGISIAWASAALAQTRVPISQILPSLVTAGATLATPQANDPRPQPAPPRPGDANTLNFVSALSLNPAPSALNASLGAQVASFPTLVAWVGVPRGDGSPADFEASNLLFGSSLVERATTLGRGRFALGFARQTTQFDALDGLDLARGVNLYFQYADCCPPNSPLQPELERDLLLQTVSLEVTRDVFATIANVGLTRRFDLGVLLPIVKVNVDARVFSQILRTATADNPALNRFDILELQTKTVYVASLLPINPNDKTIAVLGGSAHGLGDIQVQGKFRLIDAPGGGLALIGGVWLPTGDEEEWLGTGDVRGRAGVVWSSDAGRFGPYVSVSYAASAGSGDTKAPDELQAAGGADFSLHRRFGISADVFYRYLRDALGADEVTTVFPSRGPGPLPSRDVVAPDNLVLSRQAASQLIGSISSKLLLADRWLLHVDVVLPIRDAGLSPRVGVVAGLNYTF